MKIHEYNEMMAYLLRPEPRQMLQRGTNPESLKALEKINLAGAARVNEKVELFKELVKIGRASCRERVQISVVAVTLKKKKEEKKKKKERVIRQKPAGVVAKK